MKIALVHDHLCGVGGSERIFQYLCEEFPKADVYTLSYNSKNTWPYFKNRKIHTSWLNLFIRNSETFRWSFPISTYVMELLNLTSYDLVLSSSATTAKYVRAPKGGHLCYCYIPTRALWNAGEYFGKSLKGKILKLFLNYLKRRDYEAAQKIDRFIAISDFSKSYILKYYNKDADVLHCPIETEKFVPLFKKRKEHYLLISRLEKWKRVDYAIEAFNLSGKPLKVIGKGAEGNSLREMSKGNISFLGEVDDARLVEEYNECKAVIFTPFLEYGLIPLEASSCGTPVICYGHGGVNETMIPVGKSINPTAVFFYEQTPEALNRAIEEFELTSFDPKALTKHASKWNIETFKKAMRAKVNDLLSSQSKSTTSAQTSG
ncbi:MAG: hypothetical protein A3E80_01815 [Chlamydiae bacterium RIFCSPHIGHO2_12_FULL_49_9]|nr:MAG: hypothetical protein A3E80_01815 [Chlamydiae bacterium RIFCSPHIGHO2_12_FULL_49_9]HLB52719.1 glycosyltransferase [Chlamydiales bacterium]